MTLSISSMLVQKYARALFEVARDRSQLEETLTELRTLKANLSKDPQTFLALLNPTFSGKQKKEDLEPFLKKVSPLVSDFIHLLLARKRLNIFPLLLPAFEHLVQNYLYQIPVTILTPASLSPKTREAIEAYLKTFILGELLFEERLEPQILGGFMIKIQSTLIDCSLKGELKRLSQNLAGTEQVSA